jgi:SnoaL-like domain
VTPRPVMLSADDRLALSELVHRYAACIDDRAFADAAGLFTSTAQFVAPEPPDTLEPIRRHIGREGVLDALSALGGVTRTEHAIVGELYTGVSTPGQRGVAAGRIVCVAHHWTATPERITDAVWHVRYDDEYHRTDAGWSIARRALTIDAIEIGPVRRLRP